MLLVKCVCVCVCVCVHLHAPPVHKITHHKKNRIEIKLTLKFCILHKRHTSLGFSLFPTSLLFSFFFLFFLNFLPYIPSLLLGRIVLSKILKNINLYANPKSSQSSIFYLSIYRSIYLMLNLLHYLLFCLLPNFASFGYYYYFFGVCSGVVCVGVFRCVCLFVWPSSNGFVWMHAHTRTHTHTGGGKCLASLHYCK